MIELDELQQKMTYALSDAVHKARTSWHDTGARVERVHVRVTRQGHIFVDLIPEDRKLPDPRQQKLWTNKDFE